GSAKTPRGPPRLPIIGNLHQLVRLGRTTAVEVSSPEAAKEVKYGELESTLRISFQQHERVVARRDRIFKWLDGYFERVLDEHLDPSRPKPDHEDIVDILLGLMRKQETSVQLSKDHLKALLLIFVNIFYKIFFLGAIETTVQSEIRGKLGPNRQKIVATDLDSLKHLKCVIKETFRKHPPLPLLIPHYCIKQCKSGGYKVFPGTQLIINAYAIGRHPKHWNNPEHFYPE
ncbi:hypothetical protein Tsubulata_015563, partial [Turnera subulata]